MSEANLRPLSIDELAAEGGTALPDKEVYSLLDLNVDIDLALDLASPIGLAVAGNLNVAAPIDAAVSANVLSDGSTSQALADQGVAIQQGITGEAVANSDQDSAIGQGETPAPQPPAGGGTGVQAPPADIAGALDGGLLNVDVNLAADLDLAAPINGAVALNANVAAPIDAAVAANLGSVGSEATALAQQDAIIQQTIDGTAEANAEQRSNIEQ
ncbi:peptidoglycan-binding protein [Actinosynnema sp. NPDC050436]|uniref:peptidoglycan-binding protein n=1 Tax=Actinosynnema sp. NPDC050436 TaxID=3155659 RepID=UPI0033E6508F